MSNVIQFLESLGGRSAPSPAEYAAAVAGLEVDEPQQRALLDRNGVTLNELLGGNAKMVFAVSLPNEHETIPDDDKDDDGVPDEDEQPFEKE